MYTQLLLHEENEVCFYSLLFDNTVSIDTI
jgi:hypothetical protein